MSHDGGVLPKRASRSIRASSARTKVLVSLLAGLVLGIASVGLGAGRAAIRRTALRYAWVSFPLGAVIIAASINLVSGLAK